MLQHVFQTHHLQFFQLYFIDLIHRCTDYMFSHFHFDKLL